MNDATDLLGEGRVASRLAAYTAAVDGLLADDLRDLTPAEAIEFARAWEVQQRRIAVVNHAMVSALNSTGAPGQFGYRDAVALLVDVLRVDPGEARARVQAATELGCQRSFAGEVLPPRFTAIAAAQREGTISGAHARVIIGALDALTPDADLAQGPVIQELLVEYAAQFTPRKLSIAATRLLAHFDPDGARPPEAVQQRRRYLDLRSHADGSGYLEGRLTPEALAILQTILDPLSAPVTGHDGTPDPRTAGQRRHDGLLDAAHRLLRDGGLPSTGGVPTTLILTMAAEDFQSQRGFAATAYGDLVPADTARRLADQGDVVAVVLNTSGGILDYGRSRRLASPTQRCAIWARDGGCSFPGCTAPAVWTEIHHVQEWLDLGPTAVGNMTAVCKYHHRSFAEAGWRVFMREGAPWWVLPRHVDPQQIPVQNQYWRTPMLV